jgi:hypothetical protein
MKNPLLSGREFHCLLLLHRRCHTPWKGCGIKNFVGATWSIFEP